MAIERTSATLLRNEERPYTTLPNEVVQGITNPDALAIWTHLQTRATGWKVVAKQIKDHFGIGRDRYRTAMKYLADRGLISYVSTRNEAGHLLGQEIVVHHSPRVQKPDPSEDSPRVQETRPSDLPTVGESDPLVMDQGVERDQQPHETDQHPPTSTGVDADGGVVDDAFSMFWHAGMVKVSKVNARKKFEKIIKDKRLDPITFGEDLARDIKARLSAGQLGFDKMHPTTYLNQERWTDELVPGDKPRRTQYHGLDEWSGEGLNTDAQGRKTL